MTKYYKAKYIHFTKDYKSDENIKLVNNVTLDQFLVSKELMNFINSFEKGETLDNITNLYENDYTEDFEFLVKKNILLNEDVFYKETYKCQLPKNRYFRIKPLLGDDKFSNKIVFIGIPFGKGNPSDSGTAFFPYNFRTLSEKISLLDKEHFTTFPVGSIIQEDNKINLQNIIENDYLRDIGDIFMHNFEYNHVAYEKIEHVYGNIVSNKNIPFGLGGDHSITFPILKALDKYSDEPFNVIHFDAHTDIYEGTFEDINKDFDFFHHGNFVTKSLQLENLNKYIMVGLRGVPSKNYNDKIEFYDVSMVKKLLARKQKLGLKGKTYITFDIDIIDSAFVSGTATPVCFGLTPFEVIECFELLLKELDIVGIDFVEVNPSRDNNKQTMEYALNLIILLLSYIKK